MAGNLLRVFVYGTLKRGEPNHHVLTQTSGSHKFIGNGKTTIKFPLVVSSKYNIPMLLNQHGSGLLINGEVYEIDEQKLEILDELEAYPTLYDRIEIPITIAPGEEINALVYVMKSWRSDIFEVSSPLMDNYSTNGSHGRRYVERYARAKDMIDNPTNDLYSEIQGCVSNQETQYLSRNKALNDLRCENN